MSATISPYDRPGGFLEGSQGAALILSCAIHAAAFWILFVVLPDIMPTKTRPQPDVVTVQLLGSLAPAAPAAPPAPVNPDLKGPDVAELPPTPPAALNPPVAPVAPKTITAPTDVISLGPVAPEKPPEIKKTETPPPEVAPPPVTPVTPAPSQNRPNPDAALNRRLRELERKVAAAELDAAINARIGNIAASRGLGSGEASESASSSRGQELDPEKARYYRHIRDIVGSNWVAPPEALSPDISADYQVRIEPDGRVSASRLLRSSGNPEFDLSVERAVAKSSPFPPLPEVFEGRPDDPALRFNLHELLR